MTSANDELSRVIKDSHSQLQSSMDRIEQCINAAQAAPKQEPVNKADMGKILNEVAGQIKTKIYQSMVQLKEHISQNAGKEDSKAQFDRFAAMSNELVQSIKNIIAADHHDEEPNSVEDKLNGSGAFEQSVLDAGICNYFITLFTNIF